jgi:nitrogen fixation/metabolism regulation signal transduction histidine kinase
MKTGWLFFGLTSFLVVLMACMGYVVLEAHNVLYVLIYEVMIALLIVYLIFFYRRLVRPLRTIANGMDLLHEQDFASRLRRIGQPEADKIVDIFNSMMSQLKEERSHIEEQHHFLSQLIVASPMGVVIYDYDDKPVQYNPAAQRFLSNAQLSDSLPSIPVGESKTIRLSDASIYKCSHASFFDRGARRSFILIESLTDEMFKAEKLAYEKVIRMIAHEVNNSMCGVASTLDALLTTFDDMDDMKDINEVLKVSVERCYKLSEFITSFANVVKIPDPNLSIVSINDMVRSCAKIMSSRCTERGIKLTVELDPSDATCSLDLVLFEQVLINITKNAIEAIHHDSGEIIMRTTPKTIEIINNGDPITGEVEMKLFTPFFSSKPTGQGLGLLFVREVLQRHNFNFSLRTEETLTIFRINL